jgi:hypothetical protein
LPSTLRLLTQSESEKEAEINLIRYAPFPEPSFTCLSKVLINELPQISQPGTLWTELPLPEPSVTCLSNISIKVLPIKINSTFLSKALGKELPPMFPKTPISRPLRLIHTSQAATLPFSKIAVPFVKVRMVARNIRTASPTV